MPHSTRVLLALALVVFVGAGSLPAQQGGRSRVPVTVALVDHLPRPDAPFVILRRAEVAPHDVILLPSAADAAQLSEAVRALALVRRQGGDRVAGDATLRLRPRPQARRAGTPVLPWAPRVMADLRRAQPRTVPGVGAARAVVIWLPRREEPGREDGRSPRGSFPVDG